MAKKLSPSEVMRNLTIGYWVARLVHVAAKLKLADLMKKGPRTIDDLAVGAGVQPQALYRILMHWRASASSQKPKTDGLHSRRSPQRFRRASPPLCMPAYEYWGQA